jgi:lipopolysaccharide transport system ATP-binding protein
MSAMIEVREVGKKYRIGTGGKQADSFRELLMQSLRKPLSWRPWARRSVAKADAGAFIWALRDVNFDVAEGEIVGLIGRNGAGKSTLLKIMSRITEPTTGSIRLRGRLSSLLEVGTGFHPELTGRENIFLNGAILGMRRAEIASKFDEIVAFAELEQFLDTPVKRYSSGMYVRLAFAVAAYLESEILVVDEVLAVGDQAFQKKCLGKMNEVRSQGRTVLVVSHNMPTIENLCTKVVWLADGKIKEYGPPRDVIRSYLSSFGAGENQTRDLSTIRDRRGTGAIRISKVEFLNPDGSERRVIHSGDAFTVRLHYECYRSLQNVDFGFRIHTNHGVLVTDAHTWATGQEVPLVCKGKGGIDGKIDFLNLMPGRYYLSVWAAKVDEFHDELENAVVLDVEPSDYYGTGRGIEARFGIIFLPCRWTSNPEGGTDGEYRSSEQTNGASCVNGRAEARLEGPDSLHLLGQ